MDVAGILVTLTSRWWNLGVPYVFDMGCQGSDLLGGAAKAYKSVP